MGICCYEFVSADSDTLVLLYLIKFTLILFMLLILFTKTISQLFGTRLC
jgi:hypothetical protein